MGVILLDDPRIAVRLNESRRAVRFTLRLERQGEGAVLTLPPGVPRGDAEAFLGRHADWLRAAVARRPEPRVPQAGETMPLDGRPHAIEPVPGRRAILLDAGRLGAPAERTGPAIAGLLKRRARHRLVPLAERLAARVGGTLTGVSLKDTTSRWGSCSSAGRINLSWRIMLAPEEVQAYLVAHEVAHLREMNHSPAFWAVVAGLMPDHADHRAWLRRNGAALHAWQFDAA